jgi:hypothetical protein
MGELAADTRLGDADHFLSLGLQMRDPHGAIDGWNARAAKFRKAPADVLPIVPKEL